MLQSSGLSFVEFSTRVGDLSSQNLHHCNVKIEVKVCYPVNATDSNSGLSVLMRPREC